jgi:hypothetical protein
MPTIETGLTQRTPLRYVGHYGASQYRIDVGDKVTE